MFLRSFKGLHRWHTLTVMTLLLGIGSAHAQTDTGVQRLVFFDVDISKDLPDLYAKRRPLSRALGSELADKAGLQVIDQSTRDTLLLQRKINLEDCDKAECRFAITKALPNIDLMLEAELDSLGDNVCTLSIQIKSVRTGSIVSSNFSENECNPQAALAAIRQAVATIWPPRGDKSAAAPAKKPAPEIEKPKPARLQISSTPSGAELLLNGQSVGSTPYAAEHPKGKYTLTLRKAEFQPIEDRLKLADGQLLEQNYTLEVIPKPESAPEPKATPAPVPTAKAKARGASVTEYKPPPEPKAKDNSDDDPKARPKWIRYALFGGGGGLGLVGGVLSITGFVKAKNARSDYDGFGVGTSQADFDRARGDIQSGNTLVKVGLALTGAGGATVAIAIPLR